MLLSSIPFRLFSGLLVDCNRLNKTTKVGESIFRHLIAEKLFKVVIIFVVWFFRMSVWLIVNLHTVKIVIVNRDGGAFSQLKGPTSDFN